MRGSHAGPTTRVRILEVALESFLEQGYHETSMQQIADSLGITKAALYYHFASKGNIVASLIEPLADEFEHVLVRAAQADSQEGVRAAVLEGYMDVLLRYRGSLVVLMRDVASTPQDFYERMISLTARANELIAGPDADLDERIRATQAIAVLGDPLIMFPDIPSEALRDRILDGVWRLLKEPVDRQQGQ